MFGDHHQSPFVTGFSVPGKKHFYGALSEHEESKAHNNAAMAYLQASQKKDTDTLLNEDLLAMRNAEVYNNRQIVIRLIDIVLFIGKQGLALRGSQETAATLDDESLNHGNFLELVLLMAKYDQILENHVQKAVQNSKKRKDTLSAKCEEEKEGKVSKGRGSLVSFKNLCSEDNFMFIESN